MSVLLMTIVMFGLLFLSMPIAFAMAGSTILFVVVSTNIPIQVTIQKMFGALDSFPLLAIPLFILAGKLMENGGISSRLIKLATVFVGHRIGGYAAVGVISCMFFGTISGSSAAAVAAIGSILIPAMIARGYSAPFAAGSIAVSGELGAIIPPSIPLILYGVATGTSIGSLFIGGIMPGIFLTVLLLTTVYFISKMRGYDVGEDKVKADFKTRMKALADASLALVMPVIILGGIYTGIFTPTEAAAVAVLYAFVVGKFVYKELKAPTLIKVFGDAAITTATIMIIIAAAGLLSWYLTINMIPQTAASFIAEITDSKFVFLLIVNVLVLLVGLFFESSSAILILAPILTPIAIEFGVDPVHFGIILVVNLAVGMVTPPVGVNLFISCQIAKIPLEKIIAGVFPFYLVLLANLLLVTYWPALSTWLITLMP